MTRQVVTSKDNGCHFRKIFVDLFGIHGNVKQSISWERNSLQYLHRRKMCVMIAYSGIWILCHWQMNNAHYYHVCSVHLFLHVKKRPVQVVVPSSCDLWDRVRLPVSTAPTLAGQWFRPPLCFRLQLCKTGNLVFVLAGLPKYLSDQTMFPRKVVKVKIKLSLHMPWRNIEGVEL
jgi:hypothetical protein